MTLLYPGLPHSQGQGCAPAQPIRCTQTVLRKSEDGEADTVDFILERLDAAWGSRPQLLELAGASEQLSSIGVLEPRAAVSGHCRSLHQVNARHELGCCSYGGGVPLPPDLQPPVDFCESPYILLLTALSTEITQSRLLLPTT